MLYSLAKSQFKPAALEYFRQVEATGQDLIITDHGKPVIRISPYKASKATGKESSSALERLKGSVLRYEDPFEPVGLEDWEALK